MRNDPNIDCFLDLRALSGRSSISVRKFRDYIKPERPDYLPSYLVGGKRLVRWCDFLTWVEQFRQDPDSDIDQILNDVIKSVL